jgi:hypothetical protein
MRKKTPISSEGLALLLSRAAQQFSLVCPVCTRPRKTSGCVDHGLCECPVGIGWDCFHRRRARSLNVQTGVTGEEGVYLRVNTDRITRWLSSQAGFSCWCGQKSKEGAKRGSRRHEYTPGRAARFPLCGYGLLPREPHPTSHPISKRIIAPSKAIKRLS